MPHILEGKSTLVVAPTASGKTEAVLAPLLTLRADRRWNGRPSILYVAPTRALINDLHDRLSRRLQGFVTVGRRTGEFHETDVDVLLTTPESLDSMLARGWLESGVHMLSGVNAIVLDELHLVAESYRGPQLLALLGRLEGRRPREATALVRSGLSATVAEPEKLATAYLGNNSVVCKVPGGRELIVDGFRSPDGIPARGSALDPIVKRMKLVSAQKSAEWIRDRILERRSELGATPRGEHTKVIVFVRSRARCDRLAAELTAVMAQLPMSDRFQVFGHHGSLARRVREETEQAFKRETGNAVIVATSTLEVGIDIGDVNIVVLEGPPSSVGSLLQRVGRGNRRSNEIFVVPAAQNLADAAIVASQIRAAMAGEIEATEPLPYFSVAFQQCASLLLQMSKDTKGRSTTISKEKLEKRVQAVFAQFATPTHAAEDMASVFVRVMQEARELSADSEGRLSGGTGLQSLQEENKRVHVNIGGLQGGCRVLIANNEVAQLAKLPKDGSHVCFHGKYFQAKVVGSEVTLTPNNNRGRKEKLDYGGSKRFASRREMEYIARALGAFDPLQAGQSPLIQIDERYWHFGGEIFARMLCLADVLSGPLASTGDPRRVQHVDFDAVVRNHWKKFETLFDFGAHQKKLPPELRKHAVVLAARSADFSQWLTSLTLVDGSRLAAADFFEAVSNAVSDTFDASVDSFF